MTDALQKAALDDNEGNGHSIPLLITIDQEGGIVTRLGTGTALPGNMALGATRSKEHARSAGQIIGRELSSLGINVNLHLPWMLIITLETLLLDCDHTQVILIWLQNWVSKQLMDWQNTVSLALQNTSQVMEILVLTHITVYQVLIGH